ncbi:MAG: hypothetical protein AAGF66_00710 [Cyanobacteria bacterium P01_H01_bin.119]
MTQDTSLDFRLVKRVCQLQQALDQAMTSLHELRSRVASQDLVESQLAKTENFANAQQKAIAVLQAKLTQKHQWQTRMLHEFAAAIDSLLERQHIALSRLQILLQHSDVEIQNYFMQRHRGQTQSFGQMQLPAHQSRLALESEVQVARMLIVNLGTQLKTTGQLLQVLEQSATQHQLYLTRMEASLQPLDLVTGESEESQSNLCPDVVGQGLQAAEDRFGEGVEEKRDHAIAARPLRETEDTVSDALSLDASPQVMVFELYHELKTTQLKMEVIEAELAERIRQHSQLHQRCQQLSAERDYYKAQMEALQQQVTQLKLWRDRQRG